MGKALIIAEKPSVASDIAKALGGFKKHENYFESDTYVISSAVGHLLEICVPEGVEVKRGKWSFANLPVIPPRFDLKPIAKSAARLKLLAKLIKRKDIDTLINACDAGREGELIFRYVVQYVKAKQPIKRLWLQSMTPSAIREGFNSLRSNESMIPLAEAATCRSESDWIVGINGTRAMTAFNSKSGGFHLTTVGRVQTPTLTIVVEREEKIKKFVPRDYWEVHGTFGAQAGDYPGRWFDENFQRPKDGDQPDLRAERIWDQEKAEAIQSKCQGQPGTVTEESKPSTQQSPLLFDLTSLQREANSKFGLSASNTLKIAQSLYEKHKVLTYPRTDSRALPEDYIASVKETLGELGQTSYSPFAQKILQQDWVKPNKRVFNNAKISDHHAIIPTSQKPRNLNEAESKLYDLVTKRFLSLFYPPAEFLVTTRITRVVNEPFKTEGKVLVKPGWLEIYGRQAQGGDDSLVAVTPDESVEAKKVECQASQTRPPARFTEATLLSAMEGAGKLIEDEELREAMSAKGLGTPATRASIIEGLIHLKYLVRQGKELQPTAKAFSLIILLRGLGIPELSAPELTGDWEYKLKQMEMGQLTREEFMRQISEMTRHIVEKTKAHESDTVPGDFATLKVPCPKCGDVIKENYKKFQCQACDFALWKIVASRQFEVEEIEELITKGSVGPLQGFRSKQGWPFASLIKLNDEFKAEFDFGQGSGEEGKNEVIDFSGQERLGNCPKCGGSVFENGMNYVCEKAVGPEKSCDFRSGKIILQQPVERAQMVKLLTDKRTDLLHKFISKKTGRPFEAFLVVGDKGTVTFEFKPRDPSKARKKKEPALKIDFTGLEPVGKCPRCDGKVFETESDYLCEHSQADTKPCKFKAGKTILGQTVDRTQLEKLLTTGKTDLLKEFISKSGRTFSAYLVLDEKGKVGFEFPPREDE